MQPSLAEIYWYYMEYQSWMYNGCIRVIDVRSGVNRWITLDSIISFANK